MSIEAMKQALEALEEAVEIIESEWPSKFVSGRKAITALRTAIEQAEKQEPLGWMYEDNLGRMLSRLGSAKPIVARGTPVPFFAPYPVGSWFEGQITRGRTKPTAPAQEPVACKTLCEQCVKRGYDFCANVVKATPIPAPAASVQDDMPKIGCVNHDCDQCKAAAQPAPVQEPAINYAKVYDFAEQYGLDYNFLCKVINDSLTTPPAAPVQEPDEADELLRHLGLDPQTYRTDGGAINRMKVKAALAHPDEYPRMDSMDAMVSRFLTWPVPASVCPDGTPGQPGRTGTNLLNASEARQMLEHVLATPPAAPVQDIEHCIWARNGNTPCPNTAAQRKWAGLTDEDTKDLPWTGHVIDLANAIEAKLREKNGGQA